MAKEVIPGRDIRSPLPPANLWWPLRRVGANSAPAPCPVPPAYPANYLTTLNPDTGQVTPVTVVGAALGTSRWSSCTGRAPKLLRPALLSFDQPSGAIRFVKTKARPRLPPVPTATPLRERREPVCGDHDWSGGGRAVFCPCDGCTPT